MSVLRPVARVADIGRALVDEVAPTVENGFYVGPGFACHVGRLGGRLVGVAGTGLVGCIGGEVRACRTQNAGDDRAPDRGLGSRGGTSRSASHSELGACSRNPGARSARPGSRTSSPSPYASCTSPYAKPCTDPCTRSCPSPCTRS